MTQPRFDSDIAHDKSTATFAPMSDSGNRPPKVHFVVTDGNAMGASPPGAKIVCELDEDGRSHARLNDIRVGHEGEHIADVIVTPGAGYTITEETIAVASAIYWSWWRARDMHGEAP